MEDIKLMAREVRVVNPETGAQLFPGKGRTATLHQPTEWTVPRGEVCVAIRPSFRPGMPYDLTTYPADWVTDLPSADSAALDRIARELKGWDADSGDWGDIIVAIIGIVRGTNRAVEDHQPEEGISAP
jgi:hypothetical protein